MTQCRLPYPQEAIPLNEVDSAGLKGGEFGNWSPYRRRLGLGRHGGVDFSGYHIDRLRLSRTYTPAAAGRVVALSDPRDPELTQLGRWIEVVDDEGFFWTYCHNRTHLVRLGQRVELATPVAVIGQSGTAASMDHLHLALSNVKGGGISGVGRIDPIPHILARLTTTAGIGASPLTETDNDMKPVSAIVQDKQGGVASYGSMAVYGPLVPGNWEQVSEGLGPRTRFEAWDAICGALGHPIGEPVHVDDAGWQMARDLFSEAHTLPADAAAVAAAVEAILANDFAGVNANIADQPTSFTVTPKV